MNTQPEIRILDNGCIGYFYSLQQLEAITLRNVYNAPDKDARYESRHRPFNKKQKEIKWQH